MPKAKSINILVFKLTSMKPLLLLLLTSASLVLQAQDYVKNANECYDKKDYGCASDNYKAALNNAGSYNEKDLANILHRIGYSQLKLKNYTEAENYLMRSISTDATYKYPYWDLGAVYYNTKKYDKGAEYYGKAMNYYTDDKSLSDLYYWRGKCNNLAAKYRPAIDDINKALSLDPNDKDAYWELASAYYNYKIYDSAIMFYSKAIPLYEPTAPEDAALLNYWVGQSYYRQAKYSEAIEPYKKSLQLNPKDRYAYSGLGDVYYYSKDYKNAYEYYSKAIPMYLSESDSVAISSVIYFRGLTSYNSLDYKKSLPDFEKAYAYNPTNSNRPAALGDAHRQLKNYAAAVDYYTRAAAIPNITAENKSLYLFWRGRCYQLNNKPTEAFKDYEEAYTLSTKWIDISKELGPYYFDKKDYKKAETHFSRVSTSPVYKDSAKLVAQAYYKLGVINGYNKYYYLAVGNFKKALEKDAGMKDAVWGIAEASYLNSNYDSLLKYTSQAIPLYKGDAAKLFDIYQYRGAAQYQKKNYDEAIAEFSVNVKAKPSAPEPYSWIGNSYFEKKEFQKSVDNFALALKYMRPDNTKEIGDIYYKRGRSYYELGDKVKAQADFAKAVELAPDHKEAKQWLNYVKTGSN